VSDLESHAERLSGLPVAPSLQPILDETELSSHPPLVDKRVVWISVLACLLALAAGVVAQLLTRLIGLVTNFAFYGRLSTTFVSPAANRLGIGVLLVPAVGGLFVGLLARYGSKAIRGHGIPEAMEQVLTNESRIPARMTFLKPLSAAIAIGTGGPFGAEGPIIATGGALGSLLGQVLQMSAMERKTLLSAGAAAGMAATFGSPVSAVLLAVELLLFEYRPRSLIPVALAASVATAVRMAFVGAAPVFAMPDVQQPGAAALVAYVLLGALLGVVAVVVTRATYAIEDAFELLPIHFMWWPAIGGLVVGLIGFFSPRTLGVGYDNIEEILSGHMLFATFGVLCTLKFVSWAIALGSGTSGGTLAPLFTIGAGFGAAVGTLLIWLAPGLGVDVRIAALVGMAALFAGASHAVLASVVFAFETTRQPLGLLPLLGGCSSAFLVSCLLMRNSIMTEKIARRGVRVIGEYTADFLEQIRVSDCALRQVTSLRGDDSVHNVQSWLASGAVDASHQGFPVLDAYGALIGVLTRRDLFGSHAPGTLLSTLIRRAPVVTYANCSLREVANLMARERIGRLPVVRRAQPHTLIGIITRSDLVNVHVRRLDAHTHAPVPRVAHVTR
jgi:CIC family chloride channel protein